MKLNSLTLNPDNPRYITEDKLEQLKKSIKDFPEMLKLRPIIHKDGIIIAGNMRFRALLSLGFQDAPDEYFKDAKELSEDKIREFVVKDNLPFGSWEWETLSNEWDEEELAEWGLDVDRFGDLEMPEDDELLGEDKGKPPTMKITFETPEQLQKAENDIQELIDRKYDGAFYSVSCGEI